MPYQISAELSARICAQISTGQFKSEDEVLQAALVALEQKQEDWVAIEAGIQDMEAGRFRPFSEVDAELRRKHGIAQNHVAQDDFDPDVT